ncbi:hypothetical protein EG329_005016 [Mollisiaceae sp. DMI_Dod_QoI]|nr:hypothetical protein EG329_005016 [Helotiales sp. DMI_Dod_QoI]
MSAPPLSEAEPISVGAFFYNSINATFYPYEATPEAAEGMAPPQNNDTTPGLGQFVPSNSGFVIAADLDSVPASYIGEDGRLTLLRGKACGSSTLNPANPREIDTIFRDMATNSSGFRATISQETLRLLPIVSRTVIQYVGDLQANNSQLHMSNARLQATQGGGQARAQQMEGKMTIHRPCVPRLTRSKAHIAVLQKEIELVKDTNLKLQLQIDHLRQDMRKMEAQEASLKAELERLGVRAVLDYGVESSSKKRRQG